MSERGLPIADGAPACPFVAFEDDRDERATVPDHRHRCYADLRPSPRALAHQEAYCLSSAFPVCPTFQDWARRESARARADARAREDADIADRAATASAAAVAASSAVPAMDDDNEDAGQLEPGRPTGDSIEPIDTAGDDDDSDDEYRPDGDEPRRNPPRDWSAPPPWLASSEAARGNRSAPAPDFLARRSTEPGQGLAGSAADQLAGGPPPPPLPPSRAASEPPPRHGDGGPDIEELDHRGAPPPRRPRAYDQHLGGPSSGPDWERPRRYEAYPTIKSRVGMPAVPRLAVLAGLVVLVALGFYFLPAILGLGSSGSPGGGAASAPASVRPSASTVPTAVPAPTPIVYTIKKGDVLSKIAANHGITLEQLMAANKSIKDPNRISEGQEIVIPTPEPDAPNEIGPSASPEASP